MEVHAHTHTPRKKWTHYLWEFLMLFLAVFCGFLAENVREHRIENIRAKEYAKSLLNDLYEDTLQLKVIEKDGSFAASGIDTLRDVYLAGDSDPSYNAKLYWYADFTIWGLEFIQHDATLRQLLSSGNLRYFHNADLVNNITYYNWLSGSMRDMQERDRITINEAKGLHGKIFDMTVVRKVRDLFYGKNDMLIYTEADKQQFFKTIPQLLTTEKSLLNEYVEWGETRKRRLASMGELAKQALAVNKNVIAELKSAYHLK
jgi:hypothetical protein